MGGGCGVVASRLRAFLLWLAKPPVVDEFAEGKVWNDCRVDQPLVGQRRRVVMLEPAHVHTGAREA